MQFVEAQVKALQKRLAYYLARSVKCETALLLATMCIGDAAGAGKCMLPLREGCGTAMDVVDDPPVLTRDVSDDALLAIARQLCCELDPTSVCHLRQTCKAMAALIPCVKGCALRIVDNVSSLGNGAASDGTSIILANVDLPGGVGWASFTALPSSGIYRWTVQVKHDASPRESWGQHLVGVCDQAALCAWGAYPCLDTRVWTMTRTASALHLRTLRPLCSWPGVSPPFKRVNLLRGRAPTPAGSVPTYANLRAMPPPTASAAHLTKTANGAIERISCLLDVERGTLSYSVDGSPYVCACSSLPRRQILRPWIAVFGGARADTVEMGPCYTGDGK